MLGRLAAVEEPYISVETEGQGGVIAGRRGLGGSAAEDGDVD